MTSSPRSRNPDPVRLAQRVLDVVADIVGGPVRVADTLVDHHARCALDAVLPNGLPAVVKGDLVTERSAREARVLESAAGGDVPVPVVIGRAPGPPAVLVLERVGRRRASADPDPRARRPRACTRSPAGAWAASGAAAAGAPGSARRRPTGRRAAAPQAWTGGSP